MSADQIYCSMFNEPGESSPHKISEKVDRLAAASRSTIRRERTIRDSGTRRRFSNDRSGSQVVDGAASDLPPRTRTRLRTHVRMRQDNGGERDLEESRSADERRWSRMMDSVRSGDEEATDSNRRRQAGEELLRDALQYQHPGQRMRVPRSPPRTSALRFEVAPAPHSTASPELSVEEQVLLARPYMPSPPYSFSENGSGANARLRGSDAPFDVVPAAPTPGFAPARGVHRDNNEERLTVNRGSTPQQYASLGDHSWAGIYPLPPLRRVGHLSPRPESHLSRYGGLGDRRHSVSSSSSDAGHDTWETLLTTMEPDIHLPSTDSSFTSASASQSTRQSRHSSRTQETSFASTATTTERHLSRSASPVSPNVAPARVIDMDMEIRSHQYDCLSTRSRASMQAMLDLIHRSRQLRAGSHNTGTIEDRQRSDENLLLFYHFNTLKILDGFRAPAHAHARITQGATETSNHSRSQPITDERTQQTDLAMALAIQRRTEQLAQQLENARNSGQEVTFQIPEALGRVGFSHRPTLSRELQRYDEMLAAENGLESMQQFIGRMSTRQDIPDEWWATAGLVRTVRENQ